MVKTRHMRTVMKIEDVLRISASDFNANILKRIDKFNDLLSYLMIIIEDSILEKRIEDGFSGYYVRYDLKDLDCLFDSLQKDIKKNETVKAVMHALKDDIISNLDAMFEGYLEEWPTRPHQKIDEVFDKHF